MVDSLEEPTPTFPGINADLVRQYAAGASDFGTSQLLTLFDFLRRSEQRAAQLSQAYLRRIAELEARLEGAGVSLPLLEARPRPFRNSFRISSQQSTSEAIPPTPSTPARAAPRGPRGPVELDLDDI
jgi:hypothetical protein